MATASSTPSSSGRRFPRCSPIPATAPPTSRSTTATSAPSSTAGKRAARSPRSRCPSTRSGPADATDVNPMSNVPIPWALQLLWTLEPGHPDRPGELWAGTIPGGLFRSADRGDSWELVRSLWDRPERGQWMGGGYDFAGIHTVSVDPRDPDVILVAVSSGGVWRSDDAGATWTVCPGLRNAYLPPEQAYDPVPQDPHRLSAQRRRARRRVVPAPQRRVPLGRRRRDVRRDRGAPAVDLRLRGGRAPARRRHRVVRAGRLRRWPASPSTAAWS